MTEKKLKSFKEHEKEMADAYYKATHGPWPTGVQCPACDGELFYSDQMVLMSFPPQRNVHCDKCDYHGTITG